MSFPATLPSYTITSGAESPNTAGGGTGLSGLLNAFEVDITGLGTKLGTGASTPINGVVLAGNGAGTSAWVTPESMLSGLADNTTSDVSTSKHGLAPKAPNDTNKFLRGDATWAGSPYIIQTAISVTAPVDATTYFNVTPGFASGTSSAFGRIYIPAAGTITAVYLSAAASGTVGTNETSTVSLRLNDTSDTTISSAVVLSSGNTAYSATPSIAVVAGDFINFKMLTPTWATNPGSIALYIVARIT
jgi:hypothetical protein